MAHHTICKWELFKVSYSSPKQTNNDVLQLKVASKMVNSYLFFLSHTHTDRHTKLASFWHFPVSVILYYCTCFFHVFSHLSCWGLLNLSFTHVISQTCCCKLWNKQFCKKYMHSQWLVYHITRNISVKRNNSHVFYWKLLHLWEATAKLSVQQRIPFSGKNWHDRWYRLCIYVYYN